MPPVGFEPTISSSERPQTYALDRAATGTGHESDCTFIDTCQQKVVTYPGYCQKTTSNLAQQLPPTIPSFPFQIVAACTNCDIIRCYTFRVSDSVVKRVKQSCPCTRHASTHGKERYGYTDFLNSTLCEGKR